MSASAQDYVYVTSREMIIELEKSAITKEEIDRIKKLMEKYPILNNGKRTTDNK